MTGRISAGTQAWQEANARYLAAVLAWLRARMERRARQSHRPVALAAPQPQPPPPPPEQGRSLWRRFRPSEPQEPLRNAQPLLPPPEGGASDERLERAEAELAAASETTPPPALILLGQLLGLSRFEREMLVLAVAMELDTSIPGLCGQAQGDANRCYPTFALGLALFDEPAWDALSPEHPLRYWRLIEINQAGGQPLTSSPVRADERIVDYAKGLNYLDDRLGPLFTPLGFLPHEGTELPASQKALADAITRHLRCAPTGRDLPVVELLGSDAAGKQLVAAHVARGLNLQVYRLPATLLPTQALELETLARLWQRECLLLPMALYLDLMGAETEASQPGQAAALSRALARMGGVIFLDTRDVWPGIVQGSFPVDVAKPTATEQEAEWRAVLGADAGDGPAKLAGQFNLGHAAIQQIARQALATDEGDARSSSDRVWDACLAHTRPRLDQLAQRLQPKATWQDIVLPDAESTLLHQIAAQVDQRSRVYQAWGFGQKMSRGLGISVLLAGEPGTGKTMAAEVLANQLRLNLYRIDLSAVVSKYIGETEKNLRRLFDAAEDGGAVLFFDEADALFGKRSEVKDSHDRYANIEINYLLQRMEAFGGLAILATNMKSSLDQAFMRRLRFVVNLPFPGVAQRKQMWQKVFPPQTPTLPPDRPGGLDFDQLARLNLTGGNIHSAALNAAFLAAQAGGPVTMALVMEAARTELKKLGRVVNELEFRRQGLPGAVA
jgi:hypothetical protein